MIVRKAKLKDFEEFFKLFKRFYKDDEEAFLSGFLLEMLSLKKNYRKEIKKDFKRKIYSPKAAIFFAEENNKIVGFTIGVHFKYSPYYKYFDKEGYLDSLFVIKEYRGKGVSSLLKNELFEWFKSKKLKYVGLVVFEKNIKAQKVYQKWGFKFFSRKMKLKLK